MERGLLSHQRPLRISGAAQPIDLLPRQGDNERDGRETLTFNRHRGDCMYGWTYFSSRITGSADPVGLPAYIGCDKASQCWRYVKQCRSDSEREKKQSALAVELCILAGAGRHSNSREIGMGRAKGRGRTKEWGQVRSCSCACSSLSAQCERYKATSVRNIPAQTRTAMTFFFDCVGKQPTRSASKCGVLSNYIPSQTMIHKARTGSKAAYAHHPFPCLTPRWTGCDSAAQQPYGRRVRAGQERSFRLPPHDASAKGTEKEQGGAYLSLCTFSHTAELRHRACDM